MVDRGLVHVKLYLSYGHVQHLSLSNNGEKAIIYPLNNKIIEVRFRGKVPNKQN